MSWVSAEHDRMLAGIAQFGTVVALDLPAARCRIRIDDWVSAWLPWRAQAAGAARHWRAPSIGEQVLLISPSGSTEAGAVLPGLYCDAGAPPDNRDHVEVWRYPDGGSVLYDWQARCHTVTVPSGGSAVVRVGGAPRSPWWTARSPSTPPKPDAPATCWCAAA
ncbi:phage baseplate assembly protein V [Chitiniphilus shinanonensis]|uniref:phage baseplate assembly protein V n=1 Tax=Chitiniphilus shinanonensis TaxID=553088 RepID=UPI00305EDF58